MSFYMVFWSKSFEVRLKIKNKLKTQSLKGTFAFGPRMVKGRKNMKKEHVTTKQSNVNQHSEKQFQEVLDYGLKHGGVHTVASKGHGKSRLLFSMARNLRNLDNCRVLIFDGSETWLYGFDRIPTASISERDIVFTNGNTIQTTQEIEKYTLANWNLIKLALSTEKDLLFRLKSRKPSKRGFAVRTVINYLDSLQRAERAQTAKHEPKNYLAYFIEEAQDSFNSRSTTRLEAEEFLTVFNGARNQKEAFFTASQRLNDFSKTIRTKQAYLIGKVNYEDKTSFLRRLERQHNIDFSEMSLRNWFFEGKTFNSPIWKQKRKPYIINKQLKQKFIESLEKPQAQQQKPKGKLQSFLETLNFLFVPTTKRYILKGKSKPLPKDWLEKYDTEEQENLEEDLTAISEEWF
jgi:hypothetical protein